MELFAWIVGPALIAIPLYLLLHGGTAPETPQQTKTRRDAEQLRAMRKLEAHWRTQLALAKTIKQLDRCNLALNAVRNKIAKLTA